jgi:dienelactone hydrolase
MKKFYLCKLCLIVFGALLAVQSVGAANFNNTASKTELKFVQGQSLSFGSSLNNELYLPAGSLDKIPVVILLHSCGGINPKSKNDLIRWGRLLADNGYAVLTMDHLTSRGVKKNCGRGRPVARDQLAKDVYSAAKFLGSIPAIDQTRIFTLGFSLGAMTGGTVASERYYKRFGADTPKLRAVAGLYGGCYGSERWLESDAEIPVLWLVGAQDKESPPDSCSASVSALESKGLITFYKYPDATHCWDCRTLNGYKKTAGNGNSVTYIYNAEVTKDSEQKVLNFFKSFE